MNTESAIVDDVRRRASEISEHYGHDLKAYAAHLKEIESQHADRTVGQVRVVREMAKAHQ
ncbi:MAG TPA: hypothetical protein VK137_11610 [Planctomycetaceae bacterium]|nr:hypothetical protein [Planctomycetaceae bacterium]